MELIVCEGSTTEPEYFKALLRKLRLTAVQVFSPNESKPIQVVESALDKMKRKAKEGIQYEKVWCVVDVEIPPHQTLDQAWEKARVTDGVELILTNPCIEYWFLLHFKKHTGPFVSNNEVMQELKKVHPSYRKTRIGFEFLYSHTDDAITRSEEVLREKGCGQDLRDCNPSTHVHKIVEHLQNMK